MLGRRLHCTKWRSKGLFHDKYYWDCDLCETGRKDEDKWLVVNNTFSLSKIIPFLLEWGRSFTLVDPSTVDSSQQSIRVNCFQKKYPEWLPQVRKDDIVILRNLRVRQLPQHPSNLC